MRSLYRTAPALPSLAVLLAAALCVACDSPPPATRAATTAPSNAYLEALQDAEAARHSLEQRHLEQQRIDALLGRGQAQAPSR